MSSLKPKSGPLFHLYAVRIAVCLVQSMYTKYISDLARSAKSHCALNHWGVSESEILL